MQNFLNIELLIVVVSLLQLQLFSYYSWWLTELVSEKSLLTSHSPNIKYYHCLAVLSHSPLAAAAKGVRIKVRMAPNFPNFLGLRNIEAVNIFDVIVKTAAKLCIMT